MADILDVKLGAEGNLELDFADGKVILNVKHVHASGELGLVIKEDAVYFVNLLLKKLGVGDAYIAMVDGAITLIK